jgi:hypothetical protein
MRELPSFSVSNIVSAKPVLFIRSNFVFFVEKTMHHSTDFILIIHSVFRWALLAILVLAVVRSFRGWFANKAWTQGDKKTSLFLQIMADMQLLLGLVLYIFTSTKGLSLFRNFDMATIMKDFRFYAIEHPLVMIIAIVLIHIGKSKSMKQVESKKQHKTAAIFYGIALLLVLSRIPWDHFLTWY